MYTRLTNIVLLLVSWIYGYGIEPAMAASTGTTYPSNVTATSYGAVCDGINDDTSAIKAAIAAARATSTTSHAGAVVQFPAGVCYVSGNQPSIVVSDVTLLGAESQHNSDGTDYTEAGTSIIIGKVGVAPGPYTPFVLDHSFTIRGLNFIYPNTIANASSPYPDPPLFTDPGTGAGNAIIENVHVVAPRIFWKQSGSATVAGGTYGNIRFNNVDVYATYAVFEWSHVEETVVLNNFLSNPSLCGGGGQECKQDLKDWTTNNGIFFHIIGSGNYSTSVSGLQTSNLTVASYRYGVKIDDYGHLDEGVFGPTTVWDKTITVLDVDDTAAITHTTFKGHSQGNYAGFGAPLIRLYNPRKATAGSNVDNNGLDLNGFTADGSGNEFLWIYNPSGNLAYVTMTGVVVRDYCEQNATNGVYVYSPSTMLIISGSMIGWRSHPTPCGTALNLPAYDSTHSVIANNVLDQLPN